MDATQRTSNPMTLEEMDEVIKQRLKQLGMRIAYIRKRRGLNQDQLAEQTGYSLSYLAKIEANSGDEPHTPSLGCLFRIAFVLDIPIESLLVDDIK